MAQIVAFGIGIYALTRIAQELLQEDLDQPIQEQKPAQFSEAGAWIPLLIGQRRIGCVQGRPFNRTITEPSLTGAGGKGFGANQNANRETVVYEDGWHRLCIRSGRMALTEIYSNGDLIWEGELNSDDDPSGTETDLGDNLGSFRIYWGEEDQPIDPDLAANLPGGNHFSCWPGIVHIVWLQRKLGGYAVWQAHEYVIEARPVPNDVLTGDSYFNNGFGAEGSPMYINIANNDGSPQTTPIPQIGVFGDQTALAIAGNYIRVTDQPFITDGTQFKIASSTFESGTFYRTQDQSPTFARVGFEFNWDLPTWWTKIGPDASNFVFEKTPWIPFTVFQGPPPDAPHNITESPYFFQIYANAGSVNGVYAQIEGTPGDPYDTFPNGRVTFEFWVMNVGVDVGQFDRLNVGFETTGKIFNANISWQSATAASVTEQNMVEASVTRVGNSYSSLDKFSWWKIRIEYYTDNGFDPASTTDPLNLRIRAYAVDDDWDTEPMRLPIYYDYWTDANFTAPDWQTTTTYEKDDFVENNGLLYICISDHSSSATTEPGVGASWTTRWEFWSDNPTNQEGFYFTYGVPTSGRTRIYLADPLSFARAGYGNAQFYVQGGDGAPGGANAAWIIYQLLFATWPRGLGIDKEKFELDSGLNPLQVLADQLGEDGEGLRSHVLLQRGEDVRGVLNNLFLELGLTLVWNPENGKYGFKSMRPGDTAVEIPSKAIKRAPRRVKSLGTQAPTNVVFKYLDREKRYRVSTLPKANDGNSSLRNRLDIREHNILSATDLEAADAIAQRIDSIGGGETNSRKFIGLRECRDLSVGQLVTLEGEEEEIRIIQIGPIDPDSNDVPIEGIVDVISSVHEAENLTSAPTFGNTSESGDLAFRLLELPQNLAPDDSKFALLRIRSNKRQLSGIGWISRDNITFENVPATLCTGGVLLRDIPASTRYKRNQDEHEIIFQVLGEDILDLTRSLGEDLFAAGEQMFCINNEIFHFKEVVALGDSIYKFGKVSRARYNTARADHSIGDNIFIFSRDSLAPFTHPLLYSGTIHVKAAPRNVDISSVDSVSSEILSRTIKPQPVISLRNYPYGGSAFYHTGDDFDFRWNYIHPEGKRLRTGAGYQGAGEASGEASLTDSYFKITISPMGYPDQVITQTSNRFILSNATLRSYAGSTEPIFSFKVQFVYRQRESEIRSLTFAKVAAPVPIP